MKYFAGNLRLNPDRESGQAVAVSKVSTGMLYLGSREDFDELSRVVNSLASKLGFFTSLILLLNLYAQPARALISENGLALLDKTVKQMVSPYGQKVGFYFIDLQSGKELGINHRIRFPTASVAKVPVMAATYHLAELGGLDFGKKVKLRKEDKLGGSGVLQWMKPGREYTLYNLARLMIVLSDNTATRLLVREIGMENINAFMKELGLNSISIVDETMLNEDPNPSLNRTTPEDMARLLSKIKQSNFFKPASSAEMLSFMKNQRYRWGIWRGVPRGVVVADKTGNVSGVLNDVGIVYSPKGNFILSIFTHGFSSKRSARKVINQLSDTAYQLYVSGKYSPKPEPPAKKVYKKKRVIRRSTSNARKTKRPGKTLRLPARKRAQQSTSALSKYSSPARKYL